MMPTEKQIQDTIIEYLKRKKWYVQRVNSGAMRMESKGKTYMMRMAVPGTPDVLAFKKLGDAVNLVFIEVKRPGKKPTPLQIAKMQELESYGAKCLVAASIKDLEDAGI
jgi:hypothetical protein